MSRASGHAKLHNLAKQSAWHCYYCHIEVRCVFCDPMGTPQPATRDHVLARVHGGERRVIACYGCNARKGSLSEDEFREVLSMYGVK